MLNGGHCKQRRMILSPKAHIVKEFLEWIFQSCGREIPLILFTENLKSVPGDIVVLDSPERAMYPLVKTGIDCVTNINMQSEFGRNGANLITFSDSSDSADFTARNIRLLEGGVIAFEFVGIGLIGRVKLKRTEPDNVVLMVTAAAAAALTAGIPFAPMMEALNSFPFSE